jgi:hypothetical protein
MRRLYMTVERSFEFACSSECGETAIDWGPQLVRRSTAFGTATFAPKSSISHDCGFCSNHFLAVVNLIHLVEAGQEREVKSGQPDVVRWDGRRRRSVQPQTLYGGCTYGTRAGRKLVGTSE